MAESYLITQVDSRTFGEQTERLLNDLNRPDFMNIAQDYLRDAMRWAVRFPWFFSDVDNSVVAAWQASTIYPQGATATFTSGGSTYLLVASNKGTSAAVAPSFTTSLFTPPTGSNQFPPPPIGVGTTEDNGGPPNGIRWLTVVNMTSQNQTQNYWTQLSTIYSINQYQPPIDYVAPRLVEVTASNMRYRLVPIPYAKLRAMDVIRPSPITVYPTFWAWYQEQIYLWPYPNAFYPLTLSYRMAPPIAKDANTTNFWTTKAEAMIRAYAEYLIQLKVLKDPEAAMAAQQIALAEMNALKSQQISQEVTEGIPPSDDWCFSSN